jgi:hypothetical protein
LKLKCFSKLLKNGLLFTVPTLLSYMLALCSIKFSFVFPGIPSFQVTSKSAYSQGSEVLKLNQQPTVRGSRVNPNRLVIFVDLCLRSLLKCDVILLPQSR